MPEVVLIDREHYGKVAAFLAGFPGDRSTPQGWLNRFHAWWEENPSFSPDWSRGWMLCDSGRIVGFIGAIPAKFLLNGNETVAVGGTTWRVDAPYRGMSMLLKTRKMTTYREALHFAMTPAPQVARVLNLLRYEPIERWQEEGRQSVVVLNTGKFLRERLGPGPLGALSPALAPVANLAWRFVLRRLPSANLAQELVEADAAFDDLWRRTRTIYANTSVRSAEIIQWYCFKNLPEQKRLIGCFKGGRLLGFMILLAERDCGNARCIDLWLDPSEDEIHTVGALVSRALHWTKAMELDRAVFPHFNRRLAKCYGRLGLPCRPGWKRREFLFAPENILKTLTPEKSYLVGAQGDLGL